MDKLTELLNKFENGHERYKNSALFNNCIRSILNGADVLCIVDSLIDMVDDLTEQNIELSKMQPHPHTIILDNPKNSAGL